MTKNEVEKTMVHSKRCTNPLFSKLVHYTKVVQNRYPIGYLTHKEIRDVSNVIVPYLLGTYENPLLTLDL